MSWFKDQLLRYLSLWGLVGMWMGGCGTPEQKVARLIKQWQYQDSEVRSGEVYALGI